MSQEAPLSLRDPWVVRSVAVVAAIFVASGDSGVHRLSAGPAERAGFESMGRDLQRGGRRACADHRKADRTRVQGFVRRDDVRHAARRKRQIDRPRGHARPSMRDLSWPHGRRPHHSPNLAGQYPSVIYKELKDFQTGARVNAVMSPLVSASPSRT